MALKQKKSKRPGAAKRKPAGRKLGAPRPSRKISGSQRHAGPTRKELHSRPRRRPKRMLAANEGPWPSVRQDASRVLRAASEWASRQGGLKEQNLAAKNNPFATSSPLAEQTQPIPKQASAAASPPSGSSSASVSSSTPIFGIIPTPQPAGPNYSAKRLAARWFAHRPGTLQTVLLFAAGLTILVFGYLNWWPQVFANPETPQLPYYLVRTLIRMLAAYVLVVAFALPVGIIAGLYRRPRQIILPLLDILQSVPVLGYQPAAIALFVGLLPSLGEVQFGYEVAAVFLIFTGMAWAVVFSVIGAVRNIPDDLRIASNCFGVRDWMYMRQIILPGILPAFITGSILAWGGGWYFLVAAELITYGSSTHALPGLGTYLGDAIAKQGNIPSALFGLIVFIGVIYTINQMVWKPLQVWARRYRTQTTAGGQFSEDVSVRHSIVLGALREGFARAEALVTQPMLFVWRRLVHVRRLAALLTHVPRRKRHVSVPLYRRGAIYLLFFMLVMAGLAYFFSIALEAPLRGLEQSLATHPEAAQLPELALRSTIRIGIAYILALGWTLAAAIAITRSKRLSDIFFPLFDIGQSTPALALFPFMVLIVIRFFGGGGLAVEVASILLLLTGMQWYLLFNIIGAIRQMPGDILEAARAFNISGVPYYTNVLLPAIFPGILLGSVQAWGGAWNASIVSEFVTFEGQNYSVPGLGAFLTQHTLAAAPDPWILTLAVAAMTAVVLLMNTFVWKPLFAYAEKFKYSLT